MVSLNYILAAAVSATFVSAHMELLWPPALRSKYNSLTPQVDIGEFPITIIYRTLGRVFLCRLMMMMDEGRGTRANRQITR